MVIFGKLAKLLLCYKRYVLNHPRLHLPFTFGVSICATVQLTLLQPQYPLPSVHHNQQQCQPLGDCYPYRPRRSLRYGCCCAQGAAVRP